MSNSQKYKVTVSNQTFYAYLYTPDKYISFLRLGTLPSGATCVEVQIDYTRELKRTFTLLGVIFDSECNRTKDMKRGDNTRTMINATLQLLKALYPECYKLSITDLSKISCPGLRFEVSLANNNFMRFSKTWYQRYFNAKYDENPYIQQGLINAINKLKEKPSKEYNFETWQEYFRSLTCKQLYLITRDMQERLLIPDLDGSHWIIDEFPENKTIKIERDDSIDLQSGGFRRMIL